MPRSILHPLVASTVLHGLVLAQLLCAQHQHNQNTNIDHLIHSYSAPHFFQHIHSYTIVVALSTLCSILWHMYNEKKGALFYMDYGLATAWVCYDIYISFQNGMLTYIVAANATTFLTNIYVDSIPPTSYVHGHSLWHLLHVAKSMYVANLFLYAE